MHPIQDMLARLAAQHDLKTERRGEGWIVQLPKRENFSCELTIGPEALEWYATVKSSDDSPLWTDWMDYTGYGENSVSTLVAQKARDIAWFVEQWCRASHIRVKEKRTLLGLMRSRSLEAERDDQWHEVGMFEPKTDIS